MEQMNGFNPAMLGAAMNPYTAQQAPQAFGAPAAAPFTGPMGYAPTPMAFNTGTPGAGVGTQFNTQV